MALFGKKIKKEETNKTTAEIIMEESNRDISKNLKKDDEVNEETVCEVKDKKQSGGFFAKLLSGLTKTRGGLFGSAFGGDKIDDDFYEELEEALIIADTGMELSAEIISELKKRIKSQNLHTTEEARLEMINILTDKMSVEKPFCVDENKKALILIVGVNGVGKTTTIGKLAAYYKSQGRSILLAAADTFRAAAAEQLTEWSRRAEVPIVKHGEGADPAAVVFDAMQSYKARNTDILICDTAGRLHNKKNLMDELSKIRRIIDRELPEVPVEVLLVLDATTGQNAISQAKAFAESANLTGIVLTKLDGTAKGGVAIAVKEQLGLPIRFVGVGEGIDDMRPFDASDFANALLAKE